MMTDDCRDSFDLKSLLLSVSTVPLLSGCKPSSYVFLLDPNHVFVTFLVLGLDVNSLGLLDMTRYS